MLYGCSSKNEKIQDSCIGNEVEQVCTREYFPVCGCNGVTYGNSCVAESFGLKSWIIGVCLNKN